MRDRTAYICALALVIGAAATPAQAASLMVTYSPASGRNAPFGFSIDSDPSVTDVSTSGARSIFTAPAIDGFDGEVPITSVRFYSLAAGGGLYLFNGGRGLRTYNGPQLFSGEASAPTILTGTFALVSDDPSRVDSGTLTIIEAPAAVPEPATWGLMLAGFGVVGAGLRRRRTSVSFA